LIKLLEEPPEMMTSWALGQARAGPRDNNQNAAGWRRAAIRAQANLTATADQGTTSYG
jgi:hypothetical protein